MSLRYHWKNQGYKQSQDNKQHAKCMTNMKDDLEDSLTVTALEADRKDSENAIFFTTKAIKDMDSEQHMHYVCCIIWGQIILAQINVYTL